jgi:hypothetical protein
MAELAFNLQLLALLLIAVAVVAAVSVILAGQFLLALVDWVEAETAVFLIVEEILLLRGLTP